VMNRKISSPRRESNPRTPIAHLLSLDLLLFVSSPITYISMYTIQLPFVLYGCETWSLT